MIHNGALMFPSPLTLIFAASDTDGLLSNQAVIAGMAIVGTILVMRATRKHWTQTKRSTQQQAAGAKQ